MTLDKRAVLSLCLGSFLLLAGSAFVAWSRWEKLSEERTAPARTPSPETAEPSMGAGTGWPSAAKAAAAPAAPPAAAAPAVPAASASGKKRNIRFTYRDSRPRKVEIVGSFNNWTPEAMAKGNNHVWEITLPLDPGEHTYNFLLDGKPARDPNNPRTAPEGRSLLLVQPLK